MGISDLAWIGRSDPMFIACDKYSFPTSLIRAKGEGKTLVVYPLAYKCCEYMCAFLVVCANDRITWSDIELASHSRTIQFGEIADSV